MATHRLGQAAVVILMMTACGRKAPDPRYEIGAETVLDKTTHLTWEREDVGRSMPLKDAATHCVNLFKEGGGWRVPTLTEIQTLIMRLTLVDSLRQRPAIDRFAFPNTPRAEYWALPDAKASGPVEDIKKPYTLDFGTAGWTNLHTPGEGYRVRCVR